jgi:hypothetical protein
MSIKKNQTSLCSIKVLQAFTNKLLYQTLNIYKTKYLHFSHVLHGNSTPKIG